MEAYISNPNVKCYGLEASLLLHDSMLKCLVKQDASNAWQE